MSKIYLGVIATLTVVLILGFWRYSSVVESLGELEQANKQLVSTVESIEDQNKSLIKQQKHESGLSADHHEKTLKILRNEMRTKQILAQHKINKLTLDLKKSQAEVVRLKTGSAGLINISKEHDSEKIPKTISEKCAELPIPEFYLKQL